MTENSVTNTTRDRYAHKGEEIWKGQLQQGVTAIEWEVHKKTVSETEYIKRLRHRSKISLLRAQGTTNCMRSSCLSVPSNRRYMIPSWSTKWSHNCNRRLVSTLFPFICSRDGRTLSSLAFCTGPIAGSLRWSACISLDWCDVKRAAPTKTASQSAVHPHWTHSIINLEILFLF